MRVAAMVALFILFVQHILAQTQKGYPVKAGQSPSHAIPDQAKYLLPSFTAGTASLRSGGSVRSRFNYNFLLDEMQFLDPKGDTLVIVDPATIKKIAIDSIIFYYDKVFLKEIEKAGTYKLAVQESLVQIPDKSEGAFGTKTSTAAIDAYATIDAEGKQFKLVVKQDVLFIKAANFYLGDAYDHFFRASKKAFTNVFSSKKEGLNRYIKDEKINFNNESDLKKLLHFCTEN